MPDAALVALPVEILQLIGGHLDSRGLSGFSRSCKTLRAAASSSLFHTITLRFVDVEKLDQDLTQWIETLDFNAGWKSVQRVEIHAERDEPPLVNIANLADDPLEPWKHNADKSSPEWTREHDYDFAKLAAFLDRLPALTDMVWACSTQLPPSVLSALENDNRSRRLRLHLRAFCMRSLFTPIAVPIEVDSYEKRLATSPVLYSLAARHSIHDRDGNTNFNQEAIMAMAAFAAPNLEELFLCREKTKTFPALLAASKDARQKWHGDELLDGNKNNQGSLTTLVLAGPSCYDDIRIWAEKTDFGKLRTFKLYHDVPVEILRWFAEVRPFSEALEEVGIDFSYRCGIEASDAIQSFLDSLPALRRLRLSWIHKRSLQEAALRRHGDRLHTLLLDKTIQDITTLSNIRESCPNLSQLAVSITRSAGNEVEAACYRAIGTFPNLRILTLTLHVQASMEALGETNKIRTALMDSAVDESLAAAIFCLISRSCLLGDGLLETLRLSVQVDGTSLGYNLQQACKMMARSWECTKNPRDDAPRNSCIATELGKEDREDRERAFGRRLAPEVKAAIRDLWPEQVTGDWRYYWHSWPLQDTMPLEGPP